MKQHKTFSWTATFLPIIAILIALLIGLASANPPGNALGTKTDCYSDKAPTVLGITANACDHNNGTTATWNQGQAPVTLYINLTANWKIDHVHIVLTYGSSMTVQTKDSGVWTTHATVSESGFFKNDTATFDTPTCATQFRIILTSTGTGGMSVDETWPYGDACMTPPTVTTDGAFDVVCDGATLTGNITDAGTAASLTVGFLYGTDPALVGATNVSFGPNGAGPFSTGVNGLNGSTFYYFRAWANGTDGYGEGAIVYFQTTACPVPVGCSSTGITALTWLLGIVAIVLFGLGLMTRSSVSIMVSGIALLFLAFDAYNATCSQVVGILFGFVAVMVLMIGALSVRMRER